MAGRIRREGTCVYLKLIYVDAWQESTQYCNYPPIKNKIKLKIKKYLKGEKETEEISKRFCSSSNLSFFCEVTTS